MLLVGLLETSYNWTSIASHFAGEGFGVIAPDLLGYCGSDKPTDLHEYRLKKGVDEVVSILDYRGVEKCVLVGHFWGCFTPIDQFNLTEINSLMAQALDSLSFYCELFNHPDCETLLARNPVSPLSLFCGQILQHRRNNRYSYGAAQAWLEAERTDVPMSNHVPHEILAIKCEILVQGRYVGTSQWNKAPASGLNVNDDEDVSAERKSIDNVPGVFVQGTSEDALMQAPFLEGAMGQLCARLTVARVEVSSG